MEGRDNLLGKLLAQLDAPLVVGVDAPDRALDKRDVLVQGDKLAERERGQRVAEDRGRRTVALKAAGRDDLLGRALGAHLIGRLTKSERLGLGQEVAQEQLVDILAAVGCGVGSVGEGDEIGRDHHGALVQQLVEGVLTVGAGLAPEDLTGVGGHGAAVPADMLAVGLHGELLQVGRETVQVLAVRKHGVALGTEEVDVPDVEQAHQRDGIVLERRVAEVLVDGVEALEELLEALGAKHDDQRQAHGGVDGVAAADPVPETEGVGGVDTEGLNLLECGGDGDEVLCHGLGVLLIGAVDGALSLELLEHPGLDLSGVGEGLERGEGLGDDDHERGLGIQALELLGLIVGIDVGDVAAVDTGVGIGTQGLVGHDRAQIGAADADGHQVLDLLAGNALPLTGAHALGEGIHAVEDLVHVGDDVLAVDDELALLACRAAQRGVQDGAVLGGVDVLAGEHGVAALLELHLAGKIAQQLDGLIGHQVLGQVEVQVAGVKAQLVHALCIGSEPCLKVDTLGLELLLMGLERLPSGGRRSVDRCGNSCHKVLLNIRAHTSMRPDNQMPLF